MTVFPTETQNSNVSYTTFLSERELARLYPWVGGRDVRYALIRALPHVRVGGRRYVRHIHVINLIEWSMRTGIDLLDWARGRYQCSGPEFMPIWVEARDE